MPGVRELVACGHDGVGSRVQAPDLAVSSRTGAFLTRGSSATPSASRSNASVCGSGNANSPGSVKTWNFDYDWRLNDLG